MHTKAFVTQAVALSLKVSVRPHANGVSHQKSH